MNKNTIIASIIFLVIGFGAGYFYFTNFPSVNSILENKEVKTDTSTLAQNKFFEFLDSKKDYYADQISKDGGEISISKLNHRLSLMVIKYPTSQESSNYAVYDYKNNIFYDKVGNKGLDEVPNMPNAEPVEFINENEVLMEAGTNFDEANSSEYPLSIKNFRTGASVKNLPIKFDIKFPTYNRVSFNLENAGESIHIYIEQMADGKVLSRSAYRLNTKNLEVKKVQ